MRHRFPAVPALFGRRDFLIAAAVVLAVLAGTSVVALHWARSQAIAAAAAASDQTARTHAGLFTSELQKYRLLPLVLTEYPEVRGALEGEPSVVGTLNPKLEILAGLTDAAVIYVLDRDGRAVAASNWQLPTSFVGHSYAFRGYFRQGLKKGHAEEFALGAVSRRPGLFLAQRITAHGSGEPIGAVVVKVEFERIEAQWRAQSGQSVVTDARGAVLLTTRPDWRFKPTGLIAGNAWAPRSAPRGAPHLTSAGGRRFVTAEAPVPMAGWTLLHLQPIEPFEAAAATLVREFLLGVAVVVLVLLGLIVRSRERRQMERESHRRLEREVARRTAELRTSNEQLLLESVERERSSAALRRAREELAQANRLGIIGQITAGVAHEVNQPAAAIRTFAENASRFLARDDTGRVQRNLDRIVELTARIGTITAGLRNFARRGTPAATAVELSAAIDGALLLLGDPIRHAGVRIERPGEPMDIAVRGDRVRLE